MSQNPINCSKDQIISLIGFILLCFIIGSISSILMQDSLLNWYPNLVKSPYSPANEVFAPVWAILYTLMGISIWLIWDEKQHPMFASAVLVFFVGLILNVGWTFCFFFLKNPLLGFADIIALDFTVFLSFLFFYKIKRLAGLLFIPYLIWLFFATYLNGYVLWANQGVMS